MFTSMDVFLTTLKYVILISIFCRTGASLQIDDLDPLAHLRVFEQDWGYVNVRPGAHKFYWLFETDHPDGVANRPLVLWLQGGPGASSSGYGNFEIIGPVDLDLQPRNASWVHEASLLFVDHPVGAGFSYVDDDDESTYTTNTDQDAEDLLAVMVYILQEHPQFQTTPLYVFGQSYGGKMGAAFVHRLNRAIQEDEVRCNLRGLAMGNAWISPEDSTVTWGPFLYWMSVLDESALFEVQAIANRCQSAIASNEWTNATKIWRKVQREIFNAVSIDFYNIMHIYPENARKRSLAYEEENDLPIFLPGVSGGDLEGLMHGRIRDYLGDVIPEHVRWGDRLYDVFDRHGEDFMRPVVHIVDDLLQNTDLDIVVYQGQLDLICDTMGALDWVRKLTWPGLPDFLAHDDVQFMDDEGVVEYFEKSHGNFRFYRILNAGHAVPKDQPEAAFHMLQRILGY